MPAKRLTGRKMHMLPTRDDVTLMRPSTAYALSSYITSHSFTKPRILFDDSNRFRRYVRVYGVNELRGRLGRDMIVRCIVIHEALGALNHSLTVQEIDMLCQKEVFDVLVDGLTDFQRRQVTSWPPDRRYDANVLVRLAREHAYQAALPQIRDAAVATVLVARLQGSSRPLL